MIDFRSLQKVSGVVVEGHKVASGEASDSPFPDGTIALQEPYFRKRGLDLGAYFSGTINVSVAPYRPVIHHPRRTLRNIRWSPLAPAEDFSFFDCTLEYDDDRYEGLIYYPHPGTKPAHEQPPGVLEVLAPYVEGLRVKERVTLGLPRKQMELAWAS